MLFDSSIRKELARSFGATAVVLITVVMTMMLIRTLGQAYKGSVSPDKVRDFRGAMAGRGDKGLLITTGTFSAESKVEATRDGAPPIDLIDGERLCELLKEHGLGVTTTARTVEEVHIVPEFFAEVAG